MKFRMTASIFALTTIALATLVYAQSNRNATSEQTDPLTDLIFEIVSIDGQSVGEFPRLTRLRAYETALAFHDLCFPIAVGRDGYTLGVDFDASILGPRPAIECIATNTIAAQISTALLRADRITRGVTPDIFWLSNDGTTVMTLRTLN